MRHLNNLQWNLCIFSETPGISANENRIYLVSRRENFQLCQWKQIQIFLTSVWTVCCQQLGIFCGMSESFPATIAATKLGVFSDMSGQFLVRIFLTNRVMPRLFAGKMCISREMPGLYAASNRIYISRCVSGKETVFLAAKQVHLAGCQDKFQPRQRHQNRTSLSRRRGSLQPKTKYFWKPVWTISQPCTWQQTWIFFKRRDNF